MLPAGAKVAIVVAVRKRPILHKPHSGGLSRALLTFARQALPVE